MSQSPPENVHRTRALVVDDDEAAIDHVTSVLHRLGFDVEKSFDGLDALRRCQSLVYDIIVCDVRMPRLSGLSLLTNLRNTCNSVTRVVMISALEDPSIRRQALATGASAYLVKPLNGQALVQAIVGPNIVQHGGTDG
jgi:CheY-like chemotaxis protein